MKSANVFELAPDASTDPNYAKQNNGERAHVQPGNNAPMWRDVRSGKEEYTSVKGRETGVLIQTQGETWRKLRNQPPDQPQPPPRRPTRWP